MLVHWMLREDIAVRDAVAITTVNGRGHLGPDYALAGWRPTGRQQRRQARWPGGIGGRGRMSTSDATAVAVLVGES